MTDNIEIRFFYFDAGHAINEHDWIIENSGGLDGIKNIGQLESPLEHIQNDMYYPNIEDKLTHLVLTNPHKMRINDRPS